jgi:Beta-propeller repeat
VSDSPSESVARGHCLRAVVFATSLWAIVATASVTPLSAGGDPGRAIPNAPTGPPPSAAAQSQAFLGVTPGIRARLASSSIEVPILFEPNVGQAPSLVAYLARGPGYVIVLMQQSTVLRLTKGGAALHLSWVGDKAQHQPQLSAEQRQDSVSNYFIGNDTSKWHSGVANYGAVRYQQVYPGIDWVVYGNPRQLEYDFVIAPGTDPRQIKLRIAGADRLALDGNGDLLIKVRGETLRQGKPTVYQTTSQGDQQHIEGHYVLDRRRRQIGFEVGEYDHNRKLVIDPVLVYSTYLSGDSDTSITDIAVDGAGNAYVTGTTNSRTFPTVDPLQSAGPNLPLLPPECDCIAPNYSTSAFVTKFNAAGTALVYSTYLGGTSVDEGHAIAVDSAGNAYVAGRTTSTDFPTVNPLQSVNNGHNSGSPYAGNAFISKLSADGSKLLYSTYLGGSSTPTSLTGDYASAIAVDSTGHAYVTGASDSLDFATVNARQYWNAGGYDAFVAKLSATGSALVYYTFLGGSGNDSAAAIAVDGAGFAYVTGGTTSFDFPTRNALQDENQSGAPFGNVLGNAFVTKVSADGSVFVYSTYLGGTGPDRGNAIALDSAGNAYVTGATQSPDFPTVHPLQSGHASAGSGAAFVSKLNSAGSALMYSTYLGNGDGATAIAVDCAGNAYIAGGVSSKDFPTVNALQSANESANQVVPENAFVSELNAGGSALLFSTYLGGSGDDGVTAIAVDCRGDVYVSGVTTSRDFPTVNALECTKLNHYDYSPSGFVAKMSGLPAGTQGGGALGWKLILVLALAVASRLRRVASTG